MREVISNTAELGAALGGPAVIDDDVRQRMRGVLESVRSGEFARRLSDEAASGYPRLRLARERARSAAIEQARESVAAIAAEKLGGVRGGLGLAVAGRGALQIGALQLAVGSGRAFVGGGKGKLQLFGCALREIGAVLALLFHSLAPRLRDRISTGVSNIVAPKALDRG